MKGDFTRGHRPDDKRGQRYRRVLLQQGRVVLDSDHAAMVDAEDRNLRELAESIGEGSPDLGLLATAGRLRACFDTLAQVELSAGMVGRRDHGQLLRGRLPSLSLRAEGPSATATVSLLGSHPGASALIVWARAERPTTLSVDTGEGGVALPVPVGEFAPLSLTPAQASSSLTLGLAEGARVWIGLIESAERAPSLWLAPGRFHVGGWVLDSPDHVAWPEQAFPASAGFGPEGYAVDPTPGWNNAGLVVAYVEAWERLLTPHHDAGIREQALGGRHDTTLRTAVVGQVKLASCTPDLTPAAIVAALAGRHDSGGTLEVALAGAGYTGRDNCLYHFEVHAGGALGEATLEWSREGGSELFAIVAWESQAVTLERATGLREGDLVEVLSEVVELGDRAPARLSAEGFVPATRERGQLALLVAAEPDELGRERFRLVTLDDPSVGVVLDVARYGVGGQRATLLRRWHGRVVTRAGVASYALEHGIQLTLAGDLRAGDWWQWEARVGRDNDNGAWSKVAHGPERRFAPLARFGYGGTDQPLTLLDWLDRRFRPLAELDAAHVAVDSVSDDSSATSVQQALEELWSRRNDGLLSPSSDPSVDDSVRIALALEQLPEGGALGLAPGIYHLRTTVQIARRVTIRGLPTTVLVQDCDQMIVVGAGVSLALEQLRLTYPSEAQVDVRQVTLAANASLVATDVDFYAREPVGVTAIGDGVVPPAPSVARPSERPAIEPISSTAVQAIELRRCTILTDHALRVADVRRLVVVDCAIRTIHSGLSCATIEGLELRGSVITTSLGADLELIGDRLTPAALLSGADGGPALARSFSSHRPTGSLAIRAGQILGGGLFDCRVDGYVGVLVDSLVGAAVRDCVVHGTSHALVVHLATRARMTGLELEAEGIGLAIHSFTEALSITASSIRAREGLWIGVDPGAAEQPDAPALRVTDNDVRARLHGLHLEVARAGSWHAKLTGNRFQQLREASAYLDGVAIELSFGSAAGGGVAITANHIVWAATAIVATGAGLSVRANTIIHVQAGPAPRGIALREAHAAVVADNALSHAGADARYLALEVLDSDAPELRGNRVQTAVAARPLRLALTDAGAVVADNELGPGTVDISGGAMLRLLGNRILGVLELRSSRAPEISANELGTGSHALSQIDGATIHANRSAGPLQIDETTDASLTANRITPPSKSAVDVLSVRDAAGSWRIEGTHASGNIRLLQRAQASAFVAQVLANYALDLQVGDNSDISSTAIAVVTGNVCVGELAVFACRHRVVTSNVANTFGEGQLLESDLETNVRIS